MAFMEYLEKFWMKIFSQLFSFDHKYFFMEFEHTSIKWCTNMYVLINTMLHRYMQKFVNFRIKIDAHGKEYLMVEYTFWGDLPDLKYTSNTCLFG